MTYVTFELLTPICRNSSQKINKLHLYQNETNEKHINNKNSFLYNQKMTKLSRDVKVTESSG